MECGAFAGAADLCSNHLNWPLSLEELRSLAVPGDRSETGQPAAYRAHGLSKRLGSRKESDIIRRYEAGESARSLAEKYSVSPSAVVNLLRDNSVVVKTHRVTDAEARRMAKEHEAGSTMRELEAKYDLSHGAVLRALHRVGVQMRQKAPRPTRR